MIEQYPDIRWKQRFENLTKAKTLLDTMKGISVETMTPVEIAGWIHIFSLVFKLSWKTLRDFMISR